MPSLNASERSLVNSTFGRNAVLASAVVRRYKAHPIPTRWTYTGQRGALVLTAGSLKLLDLDTGDIVWETLIDSSSDYCDDANFFHSFASAEDRCMVGFCFALESEAADFFRAVQDDSSRQSPVAPSQLAAPKPSYAPVPAPRLPLAPKATTPSPAANVIDLKPIERSVSAPPVESKEEETKSRGLLFGMGKSKSSKGSDKKDKSSGKSKKKGAITKDMISGPTNFEHISHVGYNTKTGSFNAENIPEEWKIIFAKAGISEESLKSDRSMQKFAKKFMRDNADLVGKVQKSGPPPPPPVKYNGVDTSFARPGPPAAGRKPPPPPPPSRRPAPPPPPSRNATAPIAPAAAAGFSKPSLPARSEPPATSYAPPPPIPARSSPAPPPPVPSRNDVRPPPIPSRSEAPPPPIPSRNDVPPPPPRLPARNEPAPTASAPPPPPPPPPVGGSVPPPPPPPPPLGGGPPPPPRAPTVPSAAPAPASGGDARSALMDAIRRGKELRHSGEQTPTAHAPAPEPAPEADSGDIVNILKVALSNRNKHSNYSDSESDSDEDDEQEWEE